MALFILAVLTISVIVPWVIIYSWSEDCPQYEEDTDDAGRYQ